MAFATASDLAAYLQRSLTAEETATAELLLDLASDAIRSATGQTVDVTTDDTVTLLASEGPWLILPQRPAEEPTVVKIEGETVTDWTFDTDRLYRSGGWQAWDDTTGAPLRVEVTYTHGYATVPGELKRICLQSAARAYQNPSGLRSETIGSESYVYSVPATGVNLGVTLTAEERRSARRAVGLGGAYSIDTVPVYERPWYAV